MARCNYCRSLILFGGKWQGELRFCNDRCLQDSETQRRWHGEEIGGIRRVESLQVTNPPANDGLAGQAPTSTISCPFCGEEILSIAKKCRYCGEWLSRPAVSPLNPTTDSAPRIPARKSSSSSTGLICLVLGLLLMFSAMAMDTTVPTDDGDGRRVHNIGLLNEKQNLLIVGGVLTLLGIGLIMMNQRRTGS